MNAFITHLSLWSWLGLGIVFLIIELLFYRGYAFWYAFIAGFIACLKAMWPEYTGLAQLITFVSMSAIATLLWHAGLRHGNCLRRPGMENFNIAKAYMGKTFILQKNMKKFTGKITLDHHTFIIRSKENFKKNTEVKVIGYDGVILLVQRA